MNEKTNSEYNVQELMESVVKDGSDDYIRNCLESPAGLKTVINETKNLIRSYVPNTETAEGRKEIASLARKVSTLKTRIDKIGKEYVDPLNKKVKAINKNRKEARDAFDEIRLLARKPLTDWELAENKRVMAHQDVILKINLLSANKDSMGEFKTSEQLEIDLDELYSIRTSVLEEFETQGREAKRLAVESLKQSIIHRKQYESEMKELQELRELKKRQEMKEQQATQPERQATQPERQATQPERQATQPERQATQPEQQELHKDRINGLCVAGLLAATDLGIESCVKVVQAIKNNKIPWIKIDYDYPVD